MNMVLNVMKGALLILLMSSCSKEYKYEVLNIGAGDYILLNKENGRTWKYEYYNHSYRAENYKGVKYGGALLDMGVPTDKNNKRVLKRLKY